MQRLTLQSIGLIMASVVWIVFMSMPALDLPGGVMLAIALVFGILLGRDLLSLPTVLFLATSVYSLLLAVIVAPTSREFFEANSAEMRQVSILLLSVWLFNRLGWRGARFLILALLISALSGVLGEMTGQNMHDLIPARGRDQFYYVDAAFFAGTSQRLRGFFTESSVLLAATSALSVGAMAGAWKVLRNRFRAEDVILTAGILLAFVTLNALVLTKTGVVIIFCAFLGGGLGALLWGSARVRMTAFATICLGSLAVGGIFSLMPEAQRVYFLAELEALPAALDGDSESTRDTGGLVSRVQFWLLSFEIVTRAPWGVSAAGVEPYTRHLRYVQPTPEMRSLFENGIWGMKNTVANLAVQTGVPGLLLTSLGLWVMFWREPRRSGEVRARIAGLMCLGATLGFLFTCETYYVWALVVTMGALLKTGIYVRARPAPAARRRFLGAVKPIEPALCLGKKNLESSR